MDLRSLLASIDRARFGQRAPFFARTLAASRIAADQSSSPAPPSRSSTSRCSFSNTPAAAHAVNRRCAVGTVTPSEGGRCRHAHPLVSTNTIAVSHDRRPARSHLPAGGRRSVESTVRRSPTTHPTPTAETTHLPTSHIMHHKSHRPHEIRPYSCCRAVASPGLSAQVSRGEADAKRDSLA